MSSWNEAFFRKQFEHLTDKFSLGYFKAYGDLLGCWTAEPAILEIGIAFGGSLMLWKSMFPDGTIVGVDLQPPLNPPEDIIQVASDQQDPDLPALVSSYAPDGYHLVIDDGAHRGSVSEVTFRNLWPLVRPGGWYVLEDWGVGLEGNPYYPEYEGDSMARLAQSFILTLKPDRAIWDFANQAVPRGAPGSVVEVRYRYNLAMIRKSEAT